MPGLPNTGANLLILVLSGACYALSTAAGAKLSTRAHVRHHATVNHPTPAEAASGPRRPVQMCNRETIFHIEDSEVSSTEDQDLAKERMAGLVWEQDKRIHPHIRVRAIDLPCADHGCCNHTFLVRPQSTDTVVLSSVWAEYRDFLDKVQPHVAFTSILEGGGNIGVASVLFGLMFPAASVVVLEPEPHNCLMLKANTLALPHVRVHCKGLWNRATQVALRPMADNDNSDWGWRIEEVPAGIEDAVQTVTPQQLLEEHQLDGFDFVKIDIEGAEFTIFKEGEDLDWLDKTRLLAMEIHGNRPQQIEALMAGKGFLRTTSGEYAVYARKDVHALLA